MARRNQYSYSKRQREIKKKKKQEEKREKRLLKNQPPQMIDPETGELVDVQGEGDEFESDGEEE